MDVRPPLSVAQQYEAKVDINPVIVGIRSRLSVFREYRLQPLAHMIPHLMHVRGSLVLKLLISEVLLLVEQIRPRTAQIDDLRTPVSVLLESRTLKAIECI